MDRTNTPDRITHGDDGVSVTRTVKLKRHCNGCGQQLGDLDHRDVDARGNLTDVRAECPFCRSVVEWERMGCATWYLTRRDISRIDDEIDRLGVYAKGFFETVDDKIVCTGLRIGTGEERIVAHYGDWIIHHPDVGWTVHRAPATAG